MSSPRDNTDPMSLTIFPETPAALDASTIDIMDELESLSTPLTELTQAAQQCYNDRLEYDSQCEKFNVRDYTREQKRAAAEDRLEMIRDEAATIKQRHEAILSQVPPHLLTQSRSVLGRVLCDLDTALLQTEQQKLASTLATIDLAKNEFALAQIDLEGIQDAAARAEAGAALNTLEDALWHFRGIFEQYGGARIRAIDRELLGLHNPRRWEQSVDPSQSSDSPAEEDLAASSAMGSPIPALDLGSPLSPVERGLSELSLNTQEGFFHDLPMKFLPFSSPTLLRISLWLGLEGPVEAAILLNARPIQNAFAASRTVEGTTSCAEDPERLKLVLPLFTYSLETLLTWRRSKLSLTESPETGLDFPAAVFASRVVRYLEGSCDMVEWQPIAGTNNLEAFGEARRRWAIALQIFWFLEKASA